MGQVLGINRHSSARHLAVLPCVAPCTPPTLHNTCTSYPQDLRNSGAVAKRILWGVKLLGLVSTVLVQEVETG